MQKYQCLVCNKEMVMHHKNAFIDYACATENDHQFSWRIRNNTLIQLRVAFYRDRLHLKVHYDEKYSEVWAKVNSPNRIRINQIVVPDFTDIKKLKSKIRTLLVFS